MFLHSCGGRCGRRPVQFRPARLPLLAAAGAVLFSFCRPVLQTGLGYVLYVQTNGVEITPRSLAPVPCKYEGLSECRHGVLRSDGLCPVTSQHWLHNAHVSHV